MSVTNVKFTEAPTPADHKANTEKFQQEANKIKTAAFEAEVADLYHNAIFAIKHTPPPQMRNKSHGDFFSIPPNALIICVSQYSQKAQETVKCKLEEKGWHVDLYLETIKETPFMQISYP